MHYVYAIKSTKQDWIYIGSTSDVAKRLKQHNNQQVRSTKAYAPFTLLGFETYANTTSARKREYTLKHNNQQKEVFYKKLQPHTVAPSSNG